MHLSLKPIPRLQRTLSRAGIHSGIVEVEYEPRPSFFNDVPAQFGFARLNLRRHSRRSELEVETVATLTFQRQVLSRLDTTLRDASHPRFDYGPHPWSCFYAVMLTPAPTPLDSFRKLYRMARAASAMIRLLGSIQLAPPDSAPPASHCLLTVCVDALQSQGVPIEVFHHLHGKVLPERDVLASPGQFGAGAAARVIASGSATSVAVPK